MAKGNALKMNLPSVDDLFSTEEERQEYESFAEMEQALADLTYDTNGMESAFTSQPDDDTTEPYEETEFQYETTVQTEKSDTPIFKSVKIEKDGSTYRFDAVLNAVEGEIEGYDMSDVLKVSVTVEMPAKISKYKNGKVDGKKITFDLSDVSKETELYSECKVLSPVPAIIGIVLAVGAAAAFVVLKKRK